MGCPAVRSIAENKSAASDDESEALARVSSRSQFWYLVKAMRPRQWTKNLLVFAGLVFAQRFLDIGALGRAVGAFVVFCLLASLIYLINDLSDLESDRQHPTKRYRPLASGKLSAPVAIAGAVVLALLATALTVALVIWPGGAGSGQSVHISLAPFQLTFAPAAPLGPDAQYGMLRSE